MASKKFEVSDILELRVMQRIMREAKFCTEPDDDEVSPSPIVAQLFSRLMDTLIEAEVEQDGEEARNSWLRWLNMDSSREEWRAALRRATNEVRGIKMTDEERRTFCEILFCPFKLPPDLLTKFIHAVEKKRAERDATARCELVNIAGAMLAGDINLIEGVRQLGSLLFWVADPKNEILLAVREIEADTNTFPLGSARSSYSPAYLQRMDANMQNYLTQASDDILKICKGILQSFS